VRKGTPAQKKTAALPGDTRQAFRATGTSHLLAVSGLHVVLFSFVAFGGLRRLALLVTPLSRRTDVGRIAAAIALPTVVAYVVFAGAGASAVRAGVMAGAVLAGRAIGRPRAPVAALAMAAMAQLALEPACLFDPGWQLSYAAVVSLGTLAPAIERVMGRQADPLEPPRTDLVARIGRWARAAVATNVATCLATAPLVAHHFGLATPASLVANLAGVPVTSALLLPGSLLYSAAVLVGARVVARALAPALTGIVAALVHGLAAIASVPGAWLEVPAPGLLAAAAMTIAILSAPVLRRPWRGLAVAAALAALAPTFVAEAAPRFRRETRVTYLDVGQGDSALVELPGGHSVLVDAGGLPGSAVDVGALEVAPYLARRGVDDLDLVILSHPHPDHFGGLPAVLGAHRARRFWDSGQGEAESLDAEHASILSAARRAGAEILLPRMLCSRPVMIAGARFETLGPCPSHDSGWGPNDNSLVVRMTFGDVRFLFPGDVERAGEAWLESGGGYSADVVKVPHHGSRTSSGADFVAGTGAAVAVVSVGRHNRFGHPAPEVVERWRAAGTTVLRTDRDGAVVVETDGKSARVTPTRRATGPRGAR